MTELTNSKVLLVGATSGIAKTVAHDLLTEGADVYLAGRSFEKTRTTALSLDERIHPIGLDLVDEQSIVDAAAEIGDIDHVVSLAAAHANGPVSMRGRSAVQTAFDAKVIGPILLAKHFAKRMRPGAPSCSSPVSQPGNRRRVSP